MKTNIITWTLLSLMSLNTAFAQDRTTVTANNSEISDNLDLRAVASIFGDSKDLADFEYRLNNPEYQISNLDLNDDNQVDYLRVIETVEGNTHIIVIQSVLGRDMFQDIATVEVVKDRNNRVQVQVVGDVYMYGTNYIYEPVYSYTPVIYASFWAPVYRPYCSAWYWGYYPSYYVAWHPFPIFRYRSHINVWINFNHHYNYVTTRNCGVVYNNYYRGRRANAYEVRYPNRSFINRNNNVANRHELDKTRNIRTVGTRTDYAANGGVRTRAEYNGTRNNTTGGSTRSATRTETGATRNNGIGSSTRSETRTENGATRSATRGNSVGTSTRNNGSERSYGVRENTSSSSRSDNSSRTYAQNNSRANAGQSSSVRTAPSRNENRSYSSNRSAGSNRSSEMRSTSPSQSSGRSANMGGSSNRGNSSGGNARGNGNSRR